MAIEGKQIYLGNEPITLIQNNGFVAVDPQTAIIPEGWTPADLPQIQYWWRADSGVTEVSGRVSVWEDQINGHQLIQNVSTNPDYTVEERRPTKSTSTNLNSKPTILFETTSNVTYGDVGQYLYGATAPAQAGFAEDIQYIVFLDYIGKPATNDGGTLFGAASSVNANNRFWTDFYNSGGDYRLVNQLGGGGAQVSDTGVLPVADDFIWTYYDTSTGNTNKAINTTTISAGTTGNGTGGNFDANTRFNINGFLSNTAGSTNLRFDRFHIAEIAVLYGSLLSTADRANIREYGLSRYGMTISEV